VEILKRLCEVVLRKSWNLVHRLDSPSWQYFISQGALSQAVSDPKIDYWNGTPTTFYWFGSEWLLAVSKNKFCLKETKISGYWLQWKRSGDGTESYFTTGVPKMFPTVAASLG
jgi:hypothetical protein